MTSLNKNQRSMYGALCLLLFAAPVLARESPLGVASENSNDASHMDSVNWISQHVEEVRAESIRSVLYNHASSSTPVAHSMSEINTINLETISPALSTKPILFPRRFGEISNTSSTYVPLPTPRTSINWFGFNSESSSMEPTETISSHGTPGWFGDFDTSAPTGLMQTTPSTNYWIWQPRTTGQGSPDATIITSGSLETSSPDTSGRVVASSTESDHDPKTDLPVSTTTGKHLYQIVWSGTEPASTTLRFTWLNVPGSSASLLTGFATEPTNNVKTSPNPVTEAESAVSPTILWESSKGASTTIAFSESVITDLAASLPSSANENPESAARAHKPAPTAPLNVAPSSSLVLPTLAPSSFVALSDSNAISSPASTLIVVTYTTTVVPTVVPRLSSVIVRSPVSAAVASFAAQSMASAILGSAAGASDAMRSAISWNNNPVRSSLPASSLPIYHPVESTDSFATLELTPSSYAVPTQIPFALPSSSSLLEPLPLPPQTTIIALTSRLIASTTEVSSTATQTTSIQEALSSIYPKISPISSHSTPETPELLTSTSAATEISELVETSTPVETLTSASEQLSSLLNSGATSLVQGSIIMPQPSRVPSFSSVPTIMLPYERSGSAVLSFPTADQPTSIAPLPSYRLSSSAVASPIPSSAFLVPSHPEPHKSLGKSYPALSSGSPSESKQSGSELSRSFQNSYAQPPSRQPSRAWSSSVVTKSAVLMTTRSVLPTSSTTRRASRKPSQFLPTHLVTAVSATTSTTENSSSNSVVSSSSLTSSSPALPYAIMPQQQPKSDRSKKLVQIGFKYPLNYPFVAENGDAAAQIILLLPKGIAQGLGIDQGEIRMLQLVPHQTTGSEYFLQTIAQFYMPKRSTEQLENLLRTPGSSIYTDQSDPTVSTLMNLIDKDVPLTSTYTDTGSNTSDGGIDGIPADGIPDGGLSSTSANAGSIAGAKGSLDQAAQPNMKQSQVSAKVAGITIGTVVGAGLLSGVLFFMSLVARGLLRKNRLSPVRGTKPADMESYHDDFSSTNEFETLSFENPGQVRQAAQFITSPLAGPVAANATSPSAGAASSSRIAISHPLVTESSLGWQ